MKATKRSRSGGRKAASRSKSAKVRSRRAPPRKRAAARRPARPKRAAARRPARSKRPAARRPASPGRAAPARPATPSAIGCIGHHLDFTSHAMEEVKHFYTEVLGFSNFAHDPRFNYLSVVTAEGASLGFMPPMPGPPEQWRPPREPALYFMVADVDAAHRALQSRGVTFQQDPTDMPWKHRVAVLKDPEGRLIMLAQALTG